MSRIEFVRELGAAYGHISRMLPFAKSLKQRGHNVVLVLRELHNTDNLHSDGMPVLQAPIWLTQTKGLRNPPLSYPEF